MQTLLAQKFAEQAKAINPKNVQTPFSEDLISKLFHPTQLFTMEQLQQIMGNMKVDDETAPLDKTSPCHNFAHNFGNLLTILKNSPAAKYKNELMKMANMGYEDEEKNIAALEACNGNVTKAINYRLEKE